MKEQPTTHLFLTTKSELPSPDAEETWEEISAKALAGHLRDIQALMNHFSVRTKAREEEFLSVTKAAKLAIDAVTFNVWAVQELVGKSPPLSRSNSDKERPRQEIEEKIAKQPEALEV